MGSTHGVAREMMMRAMAWCFPCFLFLDALRYFVFGICFSPFPSTHRIRDDDGLQIWIAFPKASMKQTFFEPLVPRGIGSDDALEVVRDHG